MRKGINHSSIFTHWSMVTLDFAKRYYVSMYIRYDTMVRWSNGHWFRNLTDLTTISLIKRYVSILNGLVFFLFVSFSFFLFRFRKYF